MKTITLVLGEQPVQVGFSFAVATEWRQKLKGPLNELLGQISTLQGIQLEKVEDLVPALQAAAPFIVELPDMVAHLLYEIPDLAAKADKLKQEADDQEHFDAIVVVLQKAFPFGSLIQMVRQVQARQQVTAEPSPNGLAPTKISMS